MIRKKRNIWIVEKPGQVFKFGTEAEANAAAYGVSNAAEKEIFEEKASSDEQEVVFESESGSEEEV